MRILHTADWHIGQLFHEYDRSFEHQQFLNWLVETLKQEEIDVLLVSGDVFDLSNPSAAAVRMFYSFLNKAVQANPALQIIITAGNHDSASRLESPKPLLESSNIHIVGVVEKNEQGSFDYDKLIIPLKDQQRTVAAWCLAIPFLRMGDYPSVAESVNPYQDGVTAFYLEACQHAMERKQPGQSIIAMGHLHALNAEIGDMDKMERMIMGGVEGIAASAFDEGIRYVALGHIHKAQRIGGKEHIRYCGSPLPMSFSEINYKHQVVVFDLNEDQIGNLKTIEIPVSVPLQRVPAVHSAVSEVLSALTQLDDAAGRELSVAPYLEVRVLLEGPEPGLRHKVETAIAGKYVRLAKIDSRYRTAESVNVVTESASPDNLNDLTPLDVLNKTYQSKYQSPVPDELLKLFHQVTQEVSQSGE